MDKKHIIIIVSLACVSTLVLSLYIISSDEKHTIAYPIRESDIAGLWVGDYDKGAEIILFNVDGSYSQLFFQNKKVIYSNAGKWRLTSDSLTMKETRILLTNFLMEWGKDFRDHTIHSVIQAGETDLIVESNASRIYLSIISRIYLDKYDAVMNKLRFFRFGCGLTVISFKRDDDNGRGFSERNTRSRGSRRRRA